MISPWRVGMLRGALALVALVLSLPGASAETAPSKEYLVKAAFIFNFTQFVEWPQEAFPDADAPIRIGILGDDPFGEAMEDTVRGETVRHRRLEVERARHVEDLKDCHLLFIARSEKSHAAEILASLGNAPVLTVSDFEDFAERGGVIGFYRDGQRIRFRINPDAAVQRGLKVNSQLLSLGKIVKRSGATKLP